MQCNDMASDGSGDGGGDGDGGGGGVLYCKGFIECVNRILYGSAVAVLYGSTVAVIVINSLHN